MPITPITLTGNVHDRIGNITDTRRTKVWIVACDANGTIDRIADPDSNEERFGNASVDVAPDGSYAFTNLWPTNVATNPTGYYYEVVVDYPLTRGVGGNRGNGGRDMWRSGPFTLAASANMADLDLDTPAVSATWRSEFRDEMIDLATAVAGPNLAGALADNRTVVAAATEAVSEAIYTERSSVNLYDAADSAVQVGFLIQGGAGNTTASANYTTTGWIPVVPGQQVSVSQHRAIAFVQANKTTQAAALINTGVNTTVATYTIPATAAYIRVSYNHPTYPTLMVNLGSVLLPYDPFGGYAPANLYKPADPNVRVGFLIQGGSGNVTASASYTTTGWIPVTPGRQISVSPHRCIAFVQADKTTQATALVNTGDNSTAAIYTVPATATYARVSFYHPTYPTVTVSPYGYYMAVNEEFAQAVGQAVVGNAPNTVAKIGSAVSLTSSLNGQPLVQPMNLTGSANGAFTFGTVTLNGATIHAAGDDITPMRTQMGTVGANHGYTCVRTFTNPDGKTTADLGSVWTDGSREYVLLDIDGTGKLVVGGSYAITGGVTTSADVAPAGNLTHVSGSSHTGAIVVSTIATTQLYPSIGRISTGLYVDGIPVTRDGTFKGWLVEVRESYEILDYASIYDTAKANVGTTIGSRTITGAVRVTNRFAFRGPECRVSTSFTELKPTTLAGNGAVQSAWLAKSGATLTRYLPGAGTQGGFNWNAGVDMTSYATTVNITVAGLPAGEIAPALAMDTLTESGSVTVGFALGYLPYGQRSDDASRSSLRTTRAPSNLWDMRSTKKQYPTVTSSEAAGWGRLTIEGFRRYLAPAEVARVVASKTNAVAAAASLTYA